MIGYVCEPLGNQHDHTRFDCGVSVLNDYLAKYAKQDVKGNASAVFVLVDRVFRSEYSASTLFAQHLLSFPSCRKK